MLADYFRSPVPRWVDEGISVLSESEDEHKKHMALARESARKGNFLQLRPLFETKNYPRDVAAFYAQGWVVTKMLVERRDRPTLIAFVKDGMKSGWESAAKTHYGYASLAALEAHVLRSIANVPMVPPGAILPSAPLLVTATAEADGRVTINMPNHSFVPVTTLIDPNKFERKEGEGPTPRPYSSTRYEHRSVGFSPKTYAKGEVKAFAPDGKPVDEKQLLERLKGLAKPVVLITNAKGLDPAFAQLLKQDSLILVVPATKNEPPPIPMAR